ncbi:YkgJ family cysteine cluster protein [Haladaptatus sp. NG-SE-30]
MEVNCEGCAGCCIDWRAIAPGASDHERRGPRKPLDDTYNLVPLTRGDTQAFLDAGLADALTPRLWEDESGVEVDGVELAAIEGKPAFFLGLRKPPKPVAPFGIGEADDSAATDGSNDSDDSDDSDDADAPAGVVPAWLPTCVFLDPQTLQCRVHGEDEYPMECAEYPGHNLKLGQQTECERVEAAFGGERLLDDEPPRALSGLLLGPQAIGEKVFVYPDPDELTGVVDRLLADELTDDDRARFVAAAISGRPGTTNTDREMYEDVRERALAADSWAGRAITEWEQMAGERTMDDEPDPSVAKQVENDRGAPPTSGW